MSSDSLKIVIVSPEYYPLAKTGGLADVTAALSKTLSGLGHQVKVFLPAYRAVKEKVGLKEVPVKSVEIMMQDKKASASLKTAVLPDNQAEIFLVDSPDYYDRSDLMRDPNTGLPFADNDDRFIFFCWAVLEFLKELEFQPDVIQANDWQAALVCVYLKTLSAQDKFFSRTGCLLSLNNLALQGIFPKTSFAKTGLPGDIYPQFEFHGKISLLKAGILSADILSTVSETYAVEIQSSAEYGNGLEGVLRQRNNDLYGILNGVDYSEWSPQSDKYIPFHYTPADLAGKKNNKAELMKECGLDSVRLNWPVLGMVSRLVDQKGIDLLLEIADELLQNDLFLVVLGQGEAKYEHALQELQIKHPQKVKFFIAFEEKLAHLITAGTDLYLMPSKFEPCGLNQLYSMKYGTIPVVRATGGLADTVEDYKKDGSGTGFVFQGYYSFEFLEAIERALVVFRDQNRWEKLQKNVMTKNFSWEEAAEKYVELYRLARKS